MKRPSGWTQLCPFGAVSLVRIPVASTDEQLNVLLPPMLEEHRQRCVMMVRVPMLLHIFVSRMLTDGLTPWGLYSVFVSDENDRPPYNVFPKTHYLCPRSRSMFPGRSVVMWRLQQLQVMVEQV